MKKLLSVILLLLFSISFYGQQKVSKNSKSGIALETVLNELKKVTTEISGISSLNGSFDVSIKLNDVVKEEKGVDINVLFFSLKKSRSRTIDNSFTSKYKFSTSKSDNSKGFKIKFAEYINSQIHAYVTANSGDLVKNGFVITSNFTIERAGEGSASGIELKPITFGFNLKRNKKSIHTITLEYKPTKSINPDDALKKAIELNQKSLELIKVSNELIKKVKKE